MSKPVLCPDGKIRWSGHELQEVCGEPPGGLLPLLEHAATIFGFAVSPELANAKPTEQAAALAAFLSKVRMFPPFPPKETP